MAFAALASVLVDMWTRSAGVLVYDLLAIHLCALLLDGLLAQPYAVGASTHWIAAGAATVSVTGAAADVMDAASRMSEALAH